MNRIPCCMHCSAYSTCRLLLLLLLPLRILIIIITCPPSAERVLLQIEIEATLPRRLPFLVITTTSRSSSRSSSSGLTSSG